jgi:hypothetical protein
VEISFGPKTSLMAAFRLILVLASLRSWRRSGARHTSLPEYGRGDSLYLGDWTTPLLPRIAPST